jgi:hypothetical protein
MQRRNNGPLKHSHKQHTSYDNLTKGDISTVHPIMSHYSPQPKLVPWINEKQALYDLKRWFYPDRTGSPDLRRRALSKVSYRVHAIDNKF